MSALDVIFTNIGAVSLLFMRRSDRQLRAPNWSANWIFIFSHKGDKSEWEKGFAEWPCLTASSFFSSSSSIPHATSQSLSPNLLCSTWKDSGYHSFGFSAPLIPSGSIRSSRSRVRPPLDDIFYRCLGGHVIPLPPVWTNGRGEVTST